MTHTIKNRHERIADAATDKAEDLSLRLSHLTSLVKLAAFATEARRVLSGIHETANYQPELQKAIKNAVPASNTWLGMSDCSGEVLSHVARQLEEVNASFTDSVYSLSRMKQEVAHDLHE